MARIPFVEASNAPKEVADLYSKMEANGAKVGNVWKMAANSPSTLVHLVRAGNALLSRTTIDPRLREMAIIRVAELLDCEYERRAHTMLGREVGLDGARLAAIKDWEGSDAFDPIERAVLQFTDEVAGKGSVRDSTFAALAARLSPKEMVELAVAIGYYGMLARILLPFEVEPDQSPFTSASQITGRRQSSANQ